MMNRLKGLSLPATDCTVNTLGRCSLIPVNNSCAFRPRLLCHPYPALLVLSKLSFKDVEIF